MRAKFSPGSDIALMKRDKRAWVPGQEAAEKPVLARAFGWLPLYQAAATLRLERGSLRVRLLEEDNGCMVPQICYVTED